MPLVFVSVCRRRPHCCASLPPDSPDLPTDCCCFHPCSPPPPTPPPPPPPTTTTTPPPITYRTLPRTVSWESSCQRPGLDPWMGFCPAVAATGFCGTACGQICRSGCLRKTWRTVGRPGFDLGTSWTTCRTSSTAHRCGCCGSRMQGLQHHIVFQVLTSMPDSGCSHHTTAQHMTTQHITTQHITA